MGIQALDKPMAAAIARKIEPSRPGVGMPLQQNRRLTAAAQPRADYDFRIVKESEIP